MSAMKLPKNTEEEKSKREEEIQKATKLASLVPLEVIKLCSQALELTKVVAEKGNVNSISDAGVSALMLQTACEGAALNVRINLSSITDQEFVDTTLSEMNTLASNIEEITDEILEIVGSKMTV
jgi:formiminotetrahydrofolate cyclodeaminase